VRPAPRTRARHHATYAPDLTHASPRLPTLPDASNRQAPRALRRRAAGFRPRPPGARERGKPVRHRQPPQPRLGARHRERAAQAAARWGQGASLRSSRPRRDPRSKHRSGTSRAPPPGSRPRRDAAARRIPDADPPRAATPGVFDPRSGPPRDRSAPAPSRAFPSLPSRSFLDDRHSRARSSEKKQPVETASRVFLRPSRFFRARPRARSARSLRE
jgi:hypothetical protein